MMIIANTVSYCPMSSALNRILPAPDWRAIISLVIFCAVYAFIFLFGTYYIYRLIRNGPVRKPFEVPHLVVPNRPMSLPDDEPILEPSHADAGE